ncbi:hypothetical protein KP509_04G073800 [Ceratopteris richardii]|nr:hypothetical protein KP509_04G073800 [Ceratopteris richardii]
MQMPECPVCWNLFDDGTYIPRILRCGHTVCEPCLECLPIESRMGQRCLHCPECRSPCLWRGVRELPKNFTLLRALNKSTDISGLQENYLSNIFNYMPLLSSLSRFLSIKTRLLQRAIKRKIWVVTRLLCLGTLLLMFVPLSLANMFFAWWAACIGFLFVIWFTAGGFGLGAFILCLWAVYNSVYIILRLNRRFHKKLTDTG